jgi:hypothetical protein
LSAMYGPYFEPKYGPVRYNYGVQQKFTVTVFGYLLLTVTVFWQTLQTVTDRYHTITLPFGTVRYRSGPSVTVRDRPLPFGTVHYRSGPSITVRDRPLPLLSGSLVFFRTFYLIFFISIFLK